MSPAAKSGAAPVAPAPGTARIAILDGYRALAILFVLAFHYTVRWAPPRDAAGHLAEGVLFKGIVPFEYGWMGVEFFFVISGFVILMTLERCKSLADFAVRRFARLWPALLTGAALTTVAMALIGPPEWQVGVRDFAGSIVLLPPEITGRLFHHAIHWVDGAYWSLWVEVRFYALAALLFLFAGKRFVRYWLVLQIVVFAAATALHPLHDKTVDLVTDTLCFPAHMPYFTLGLCLYEIYSGGALKRLAVGGAVLACAIVLFSAAATRNIFEGYDPLMSVLANGLIFGLFVLFLRDHALARAFAWEPLVAVGRASYSLYLIHQLIGVALIRSLIGLGLPYLAALPLVVILIVAAALALFRLVETPAKRWILSASRDTLRCLDHRWLRFGNAEAFSLSPTGGEGRGEGD